MAQVVPGESIDPGSGQHAGHDFLTLLSMAPYSPGKTRPDMSGDICFQPSEPWHSGTVRRSKLDAKRGSHLNAI